MASSSGSRMRFGLIADLQYADADDGSNYDKTSIRRYRQSLDICREALRSFAVDSVETVVTLGDLLDGRARKLGKHHQGARDLVEAFIGEEVAVFSVIGNHDLYNFTRTEILSNHRDYIAKAKLPESVASAYCRYSDSLCPGKMYGSFTPTHGFRFIFLDGFDVSCVESSSTTNSDEAWTFLSTRNPNITDRHNLYNCDFNKNLGAGERHFVPYNGAVSRAQVDWLRDELRQADSEGESVFVFCHVPTHPGCCKQSCLLWNYEEVLAVMQASKSVVAYFAGHDHEGGYCMDDTGIHHIVPPAPLECDEGQVAYGWVEVFESHMEVHWTGKEFLSGSPLPPKLHMKARA